MAGYTRQSVADIINGLDITAPPLNAEFNQLAAAMHAVTGHAHDGSTGSAPPIPLATSVSGLLPAVNGGSGGRNKVDAAVAPTATDDTNSNYAPGSLWLNTATGRVYVCLNATATAAVWREYAQITEAGVFFPETDDTVDLGTATYRFRNAYLSGALTVGGNATVTGGVTAASFSGPLTGTVTGDVTGNLTGNVTGNITGDVTGNVTAATGSSTFNNLVVNGTADFTNAQLTNVADPTAATDAATKSYVDGVAFSATGALTATNNLSDLDNAATARTNLGLGSAATTASSAYATAAQGTKADSAVQPAAISNSTNWDTAYGWGNHASAGYAASASVLALAGGTMSGAINMGGFGLTNVGSLAGNVLATQVEAEAGTNNTELMTPLRTKQAIDALAAIGSEYEEFLTSGTWTKPSDVTWVYVEAIGGGGSGGKGSSSAGGGGGGGFADKLFRVSDLPASVTVTIGAGGAAGVGTGASGGQTTFGSYITGYGGAGGGAEGGAGGMGGAGGTSSAAGGSAYASAGGGLSARDGGNSARGGAGGGGHNASGGTSGAGGNGGDGSNAGTATAGMVPGGGGGGSFSGTAANGAAGRVRVWAW